MIERFLSRVPAASQIWVASSALALVLAGIGFVLREPAHELSRHDEPVASFEMPHEWRLPPGVVVDFSLGDRAL